MVPNWVGVFRGSSGFPGLVGSPGLTGALGGGDVTTGGLTGEGVGLTGEGVGAGRALLSWRRWRRGWVGVGWRAWGWGWWWRRHLHKTDMHQGLHICRLVLGHV